MSASVEISGIEEFKNILSPDAFRDAIREGLIRGIIDLQKLVKSKLNGEVLNRLTGTLSRSIHERVDEEGSALVGKVGSFAGYPNPKGNQEAAGYARINEFGGTYKIPEHQRRMTSIFGKEVEPFMQTVKAHTATYPERSFLRSSLRESRSNIAKEILTSLKIASKNQ